jgi:phosphatidylinositol 4-kinase
MQEPEIFEQPVANRDPEAHPGTDENGTYGGTVYSNGLRPAVTEDDESGEYHDFVYPEGGPHLPSRLRWR